jgi:hypothetical protein
LSLQGRWPRFFLFLSAACALELVQSAAAQDESLAVARDDEHWQQDDVLRSIADDPTTLPETAPLQRIEDSTQQQAPSTLADDPTTLQEREAHQPSDDSATPLEHEAHQPADDQILPEPPAATTQPTLPEQELPLPDSHDVVANSDAAKAIGNDDVRAMATAQFSETTMLATIAANPTSFDVSPRALVALKNAGVSERVIEAMIAAESAKKQALVESTGSVLIDGATSIAASIAPTPAAPAAAAPATAMPSEEFTKLSAMIEQLAAQQEAAIAARKEPEPPRGADPSPHAWFVGETDKTALAPTIAQVAFTEERSGATFKTLHGLANTALAFANPAVSGIATTLGGLFRPNDDEQTAVWALAGGSSVRELGSAAAFEIEFGNIPGVDPDKYRPAIVRLVRTSDNYRLVAAAKTDGASKAVPSGPIVEEAVATDVTKLGRGRYRAASRGSLGAGEYALVLRPVMQKERPKRRSGSEASLGELLGGGTSQILYFTWDFTVATL